MNRITLTLCLLIVLLCLGGCIKTIKIERRLCYEGDENGHYCEVKMDSPLHGATYCEWNYARGYKAGLEWKEKPDEE